MRLQPVGGDQALGLGVHDRDFAERAAVPPRRARLALARALREA
jgi:hypothetical protein